MKQLAIEILRGIGNKLGSILISLISTIKLFLQVKEKVDQRKEEKQKKKETDQKEDKIDDVCDNGSLDDLFDLKGDK